MKENKQVVVGQTVGYIRVSTVEQGMSGLSLEAQEQEIREHCKKNKLGEPQIFVDDSSGKDLNRPGLQEVFNLFKKGELENLIFTKVDRFSRNLSNAVTCLDNFNKGGVKVHCLQIPGTLGSSIGKAIYGIISVFAEMERDYVSERTEIALKRKKEKGEHCGRIPFGKKIVNKKLVTDMDEHEVVRKIMDLHNKGVGYLSIAKKLNKEGIKTRQGSNWHQTSVCRVVQGVLGEKETKKKVLT